MTVLNFSGIHSESVQIFHSHHSHTVMKILYNQISSTLHPKHYSQCNHSCMWICHSENDTLPLSTCTYHQAFVTRFAWSLRSNPYVLSL